MTLSKNPQRYDEKRKDIRHGCQKLADVFIGAQRYSGLIRNESKGGVFVETRGSFLAGDDVMVVYESPIGIDQKRTGKIVKIDPNGIGVRFNYPGYNL
jgi:Tfp pilus assembly protein PilZ